MSICMYKRIHIFKEHNSSTSRGHRLMLKYEWKCVRFSDVCVRVCTHGYVRKCIHAYVENKFCFAHTNLAVKICIIYT